MAVADADFDAVTDEVGTDSGFAALFVANDVDFESNDDTWVGFAGAFGSEGNGTFTDGDEVEATIVVGDDGVFGSDFSGVVAGFDSLPVGLRFEFSVGFAESTGFCSTACIFR